MRVRQRQRRSFRPHGDLHDRVLTQPDIAGDEAVGVRRR
jgi:hypothetical protein